MIEVLVNAYRSIVVIVSEEDGTLFLNMASAKSLTMESKLPISP